MDILDYLPKDPMWYHYMRLSDGEQKLYMQLFRGVVQFSPKITITGLSFPKGKEADIISNILGKMKDDIPELFYLGNSTIWTGNGVWVEPRYCFSPSDTVKILKKIRRKTMPLLMMIGPMRELDKLVRIHDYLVEHCTYGNTRRDAAHRIDGAFLEGTPVCDGFSRAAQYLCVHAGIQCTKVRGDTRKAENGNTGHSWNIVWLRNKPYHMDVTFDAAQSGGKQPIRYDYFLLSDREIAADRIQDRKLAVPACPQSYRYYEKTGAYYMHEEKLCRDILSAARTKKTILFQLPQLRAGKAVTCRTVNDIIKSALTRENVGAAWTLESNDTHRVYCIRFR